MNIKEKLLRKERSWTDILILVFIQAYLWMQLGGFLSMEVLKADKWGYLFTDNAEIAVNMGEYFVSFGFWISMIFGLVVFKKNRKLLKPLCPEKKMDIFKGMGLGLLAGSVLNASIIAGAIATGSLSYTKGNIQVLPIIGYFAAILFQAGGEELICRMYIMGKLKRRYKNQVVAIVGNSLLFTVMHLGNPGVTVTSVLGVLAVSILFSLIVYYSENIWTAIAMHTAWNFTQTIVFGLPNSGVTSPYSILKTEKAVSGFCFDTGFGVEGSLAVVLVLCLAITAVALMGRKTGKKESIA